MLSTPQIVESPMQLAAVIHLTIPRAEIQHVMGPGIHELIAALEAQGIPPVGPWFTHHLKMSPDVFDFEIGIPIGTPVTPVGRVKPGALTAAKVVRRVYAGGYEGLGDAWGEFCSWIQKEGLSVQPDLWEVYLQGPETDPDPATYRTELNQPLR